MKCVGVVGHQERKERIRERKGEGSLNSIHRLIFCYDGNSATALYILGVGVVALKTLPSFFCLVETIETTTSTTATLVLILSYSLVLPAWLTTSQTYYVTLDHCLLDYSC